MSIDINSRMWQAEGAMAFRLVPSGYLVRGKPTFVNEFSIQVSQGQGTTREDAQLLAQGIADLLNAEIERRAKG